MKTGLAAGLLVGMLAAGSTEPARIPKLHGKVLTGEAVDLPEALKGKAGVLVLGFSQASRGDVAAWGKRLAADYRDSNQVIYFEMPMLAGVPRVVRGWVTGKIKESVPARAQARFLPVNDHEREWRAAAGYTKADDAYVLVVDGGGVVRFRTEGAASDGVYAEVKKRVDGMR